MTGSRAPEALLALVAAQDDEAFGELYDSISRRAYGLALRIVGEAELAEAAVEEAFVSVWRTAHRFHSALGAGEVWVLELVRRRAIEIVRRERPQAVPEASLAGMRFFRDRGGKAALGQERRRIERALATLTPGERHAVSLAYYDGLTQTQVAERLQIPVDAAQTRLSDGLRALATQLAPRGDTLPVEAAPETRRSEAPSRRTQLAPS